MQRTRTKISGLIAVNLALLAILAVVTWAPATRANSEAGLAGDYLMIGGAVNGLTSNAVYILDQRSGVLLGLKYELGTKKLKAMNGTSIRNVNEDAKRAGPGR